MTKQEVIKQAYGEHWGKVKTRVDENGWCFIYYEEIGINIFGTEYEFKEFSQWRPISLKGIETNNGWIKIESGNDIQDGDYWMLEHDGTISPCFEIDQDSQKNNLHKYYTHYQPIVKPLPPIY